MFRLEGEFYTLIFDGVSTNIGERDGLAYIHELLAHPGKPVLKCELHRRFGSRVTGGPTPLLRPLDHEAREADMHLASAGTSDPEIDDQAKAEYLARLQDLDEDIREAEEHNDPERARIAQSEKDVLIQHLSQAFGLGRRSRREADPDK